MLHLIGIGLGNELDITLKGLETIRKCSDIYLEGYTSKINATKSQLEQLYGREIMIVDRSYVENLSSDIIKRAKTKEVAFLVIGDALSATTHTDLKATFLSKLYEIMAIVVTIKIIKFVLFLGTSPLPIDWSNLV